MVIELIEEALIANLRELPAEKQREVLDFASLLNTREPALPKLKSARGLPRQHFFD